MTSLIADLGGLTGLWIGISVVSILEVVQLIWFCMEYIHKKKYSPSLIGSQMHFATFEGPRPFGDGAQRAEEGVGSAGGEVGQQPEHWHRTPDRVHRGLLPQIPSVRAQRSDEAGDPHSTGELPNLNNNNRKTGQNAKNINNC